MKAIYFTGHGVAELAQLPDPELKPGHALIDVKASGLCHTDIDVLHGRYGSSAFPLVPGHEYVGVVLAVAENVTNVKPGIAWRSIRIYPVGIAVPARRV